MEWTKLAAIGALGLGCMLQAAGASAQEPAWSAKVSDLGGAAPAQVQYQPLDKASKPWKICVLFPHMKDTIWLAMDYGVTQEARRQGVEATIYQAGGYENLPKQLSQFDDCMASNFDAIVVGAISEAGLARKFKEAKAAGKPVIAVLNPIDKADTAAKVFADNVVMGEQTGNYLVKYLNGKQAKAVAFPGPAGSGWAEQFATGFKNVLAKHDNIQLLDEKYGDSGVAVQLGLVQNALQAYPDMNVIWGNATMVEAALGAVGETGRNDILIMSAYENQAMLDALRRKDILGFATQYPVLQGRIGIDLAVRALEKKPLISFVSPIPVMVSAETLQDIDMAQVLAPAGFKAVYSVAPGK